MGAHAHRHNHLLPRRGGHHHRYPKRLRKGRPADKNAHPHRVTVMFGRTKPPTTGTKRVKRVWRAIYSWFPHAASLGIFNCRRISGSSSWSQHAWADALDISSPDSLKTGRPTPYLDAIVAYVRNLGPWITRVIYRDGAHQNHAHIDVEPDQVGTPPCAGG